MGNNCNKRRYNFIRANNLLQFIHQITYQNNENVPKNKHFIQLNRFNKLNNHSMTCTFFQIEMKTAFQQK